MMKKLLLSMFVILPLTVHADNHKYLCPSVDFVKQTAGSLDKAEGQEKNYLVYTSQKFTDENNQQWQVGTVVVADSDETARQLSKEYVSNTTFKKFEYALEGSCGYACSYGPHYVVAFVDKGSCTKNSIL